jgi:hypothetical protein
MSMTMPNDFLDLFTEDKLPELKAVYKTKAESYPSMIPLLANIGSFGNSDIVQTTTISGVGDFGETLAGQDAKVGYIRPGFDNTIVAKKYTNSVIVPKEFITDTKQNLLKYAMESFAKGAFEIQEKKLAQIFLEAFSTTGYDGVALCSASHPLENGNGLTWSNLSSAADLDITSFRDTRDVLQDTPNEDGQLVNMMPKLFVCGQELQDKAHEIVKSMYNPENANNAVNSVTISFSFCRMVTGLILEIRLRFS